MSQNRKTLGIEELPWINCMLFFFLEIMVRFIIDIVCFFFFFCECTTVDDIRKSPRALSLAGMGVI